MNLSYWEIKSWLSNIDYTIVGSGIVGLNCALRLKEKFPKSKILILEKGSLPQGASTKNAGFACFGSASEIIDDLKSHSESEIISLIKKRIEISIIIKTKSTSEHHRPTTGGTTGGGAWKLWARRSRGHVRFSRLCGPAALPVQPDPDRPLPKGTLWKPKWNHRTTEAAPPRWR